YRAWQRMKTACTNKNHPSYKTYGARGVRFDPKWEKFTNFAKDMGDIPEECTGLELINLDADFSKFNCRWVNKKTRRSLSDMPNQSNKGRKRKYVNPRSVAVVLENNYFEFVQKMAISKSQEIGRP